MAQQLFNQGLSGQARIESLEKKVDYLFKMVMGDVLSVIELYPIQQEGWTSAPAVGTEIGLNGDMGQNGPGTLALPHGHYAVVETREYETADHGKVRWVRLRCGAADPTETSDGWAWAPVRPTLMDAGQLYQDLQMMPDDFTTKVWEELG